MINHTSLVILDEYTGLHFYTIRYNKDKVIKAITHIYEVSIQRATHFSSYGNTFMVSAKTVDRMNYVVEVFVDLE
jgi:hypothetical protein